MNLVYYQLLIIVFIGRFLLCMLMNCALFWTLKLYLLLLFQLSEKYKQLECLGQKLVQLGLPDIIRAIKEFEHISMHKYSINTNNTACCVSCLYTLSSAKEQMDRKAYTSRSYDTKYTVLEKTRIILINNKFDDGRLFLGPIFLF